MEAVQVVEGVLRLLTAAVKFVERSEVYETHIHHVVEDDKRSALCFLLIANAYLANAPIPSKQVVQVLACDLVVQVLDKQDPIRTRREF